MIIRKRMPRLSSYVGQLGGLGSRQGSGSVSEICLKKKEKKMDLVLESIQNRSLLSLSDPKLYKIYYYNHINFNG